MELLPDTLSTLAVVVFFIAAFLLFVGPDIMSTEAKMVQDAQDLNKVDAAHLVESCLKNGKEYIEKDFLDSAEGGRRDICEICGICILDDLGASVVDLETRDTGSKWEWGFGYDSGSDFTHSISVNIDYGDEIHVGRLYVSI